MNDEPTRDEQPEPYQVARSRERRDALLGDYNRHREVRGGHPSPTSRTSRRDVGREVRVAVEDIL